VSERWVAYVVDRGADEDVGASHDGGGPVLRVPSLPEGMQITVTDLGILDVTKSSSETLE
jgi:hypothetical protein